MPLAFTLILLGLQRWRAMPVFLTSRYPAMTAGFWIAGLVLLSAWAVRRMGWRPAVLWLLMAPWLIAGWVGSSHHIADQHVTVFQRKKAAPFMPPPGATLFVMPASLAPYVRDALAPWQVRPAAALPCTLAAADPADTDDAWVLDLNYLHMLDEEGNAVLAGAIRGGALGEKVKVRFLPPPQFYTLYHLTAADPARARDLCARGALRPKLPPIPETAAAVALPGPQRLSDGWWWPDVDPGLGYRRWWTRSQARLVFDRPVAAGDYVLHYRGFCPGHEEEPRELHLRLEGAPAGFAVRHEAGEIAVDVPVHLAASALPPVLRLAHPMEPVSGTLEKYPPIYRVGSQLRYAWLERPAPAIGQPGPLVLGSRQRRRLPVHVSSAGR